jgi:hypothetical protein
MHFLSLTSFCSHLKGIEFDIVGRIGRRRRPEDKEEQKMYVVEKRWRDSKYKTIPISVYLVA